MKKSIEHKNQQAEINQKNIYWLPKKVFRKLQTEIKTTDLNLQVAISTPCETLRAKGNTIKYASPRIFSGLCKRQGSWYRNSNRFGLYLLVGETRLPGQYHKYIDSTFKESDFFPDNLPDTSGLKNLIKSPEYQSKRPDDWENKTIVDSFMFKIMFTLTGFWGWGDNLKKHWLHHRANHANFLSHQYTTNVDGESVPYSVTGNDGVCSSCVEFFNIIDQGTRKMVSACPGSVTFAGTKRKTYYDINPVKFVTLESIS